MSIMFCLVKIIDFSDEPKVRYSRLNCQLNQIYNLKDKNPDIVFFGSSRTLAGINPYIIEDEIGKVTNQTINVLNLSRSWRGNGQIYQMIKDFYMNAQKISKAVVIEFSSFAFSNKGNSDKSYFGKSIYYQGYYPLFYKNANFQTLIFDIKSKNHQNFIFNLRDFFELIFYKIKSFLALDNKGRILKNKNYNKMKLVKKHCYSEKNENKLNEKKIKQRDSLIKIINNENHKKNWKQKNYFINTDHVNFHRPNFYLNEIIKFLENNNVKVYILIMPRLNFGLPSKKLIKDLKIKFPNTEILYGDKSIYEKIYVKKGWRDTTHMVKYSRDIWSKWIANKIVEDF